MIISEKHWYRIKESTKDEYVTQTGNKLERWSQLHNTETDKKAEDKQKFRFIKVLGRWFIQVKSDPKEFITVRHAGVPGDLHGFAPSGNLNHGLPMSYIITPVGGIKVKVQEPTKNEYMSIGHNGWVVRWGFGDTSVFSLEQQEEIS